MCLLETKKEMGEAFGVIGSGMEIGNWVVLVVVGIVRELVLYRNE